MKGILGISAAVLMAAMLSTPAIAQQSVPRAVHNGNADIVSQGAPNTDLNMDRYKAFDQFAAAHPEVIKQLRMRPALIESRKFLATHSELEQFMKEHPDWRADFAKNPGNYVPLSRHAKKSTAERMAKNHH